MTTSDYHDGREAGYATAQLEKEEQKACALKRLLLSARCASSRARKARASFELPAYDWSSVPKIERYKTAQSERKAFMRSARTLLEIFG